LRCVRDAGYVFGARHSRGRVFNPLDIVCCADGRAPRASAITILIAGGLILLAIQTQPGGYTLQEIPDVFVRVIAPFIS